jgi:RNA polymerase sigma factor (sigma-70 family)
MVWSVCRRVLGNHHDAEDAFQATFLVLVRRAASVWPRDLVANWLYGVAHQTALKARATLARRRLREQQSSESLQPQARPPDSGHELRTLLDQELSRLPDKYRIAIVLCDLEGKTRRKVAEQLGLADGTVASRLARGRALLAKRLTRRGILVTGAGLPVMLAEQAAFASAPLNVTVATVEAVKLAAEGMAAISGNAAALAQTVVQTMWLSKLKTTLALVAVLGAAAVAWGVWIGPREDAPPAPIVKTTTTTEPTKTKRAAEEPPPPAAKDNPPADKTEPKGLEERIPGLPKTEDLLRGRFVSDIKVPFTMSTGFRFRYPFEGPGAMITFGVDKHDSTRYLWPPKVDASTAQGRKAIFEALRDAQPGLHFTMDGTQLVVFGGARIVPFHFKDERLRKSWIDAIRRIPPPLFTKFVKDQHAAAKLTPGPVEGSYLLPLADASFFAALTSKEQVAVLWIRRQAPDDFKYYVGHYLLEPSP